MKKKGFTLIELLAVIVILAVIALIAVPLITKVINNTKEKSAIRSAELYSTALIEQIQAEMMSDENLEISSCTVNSDGTATCGSKTITVVTEETTPTSGTINISNGKIVNDSTLKINGYCLKYSNGKWTITECETSGGSSSDKICTAVTVQASGEYNTGDKYSCEVKEGTSYNFYILSVDGDKVSLLMDSNINYDGTIVTDYSSITIDTTSTYTSNFGQYYGIQQYREYGMTPWVTIDDYKNSTEYGNIGNNSKGPITAMQYLYDATKNWSNIPNISINYNDVTDTNYISETYGAPASTNTYNGIYTTNSVTKIIASDGVTATWTASNLKARLPYGSELAAEMSSEWLGDNLDASKQWYGYWSSTTSFEGSGFILSIFEGSFAGDSFGAIPFMGVRPVIELTKSNLQ